MVLDERRAADAQVHRLMAEIGYDVNSDIGRILVKQLTQAITGELVMMVRTGQLWARALRHGVVLKRPAPWSWREDVTSYAFDAASSGASRFVAEKLRYWDPDGKASLLTYAVTFVLINDFSNMYRRHQRAERPSPEECSPLPPELPNPSAGADGLRDTAVAWAEVANCLRTGCWVPPNMPVETFPRILDMRRDGIGNTEIGRILGTGRRAVERRMVEFARHLVDVHGWVRPGDAR